MITREIKMPAKKMLSELFLIYGWPWFTGAIIGIVLFVVLGLLLDVRFFMVALIWIFLFVPLVVAFLYFFYGMEPLTTFNVIDHRLEFKENEIEISMPQKKEIEDDETKASEKRYIVSMKDFRQLKSGSDHVLLFFQKQGWIWLPVNAFDSIEDFRSVLNALTRYPQN